MTPQHLVTSKKNSQILYACLAYFCPLMCSLSVYARNYFTYEQLAECQTISSNFAITHRYLLCDVMFRTIIAEFTGEKNWKLSSIKLIHKCMVRYAWIGNEVQNWQQ